MDVDFLDEILACPLCRGTVERAATEYRCVRCDRTFPIRYGIPDFRLEPDPYISIDAEIAKIEGFTAHARKFADMVRAYYVLTPESPPNLHARYLAAMDASVARGGGILKKLRSRFGDSGSETLLDLGCGTGGLAIAGSKLYGKVVGVDVALRWLVMGKQRLAEHKVDIPLVCANAESLPFKDSVFDAVAADAVLEHVRDPERVRDETLRTLKNSGAFFFLTNNRYSVLPEPHVRLIGFGLIPRRFQERASWALRKTPYRARLRSRRELKKIFAGRADVILPYYSEGELGESNEGLRKTWERLTSAPLFSTIFGGLVPHYFVVGSNGRSSR